MIEGSDNNFYGTTPSSELQHNETDGTIFRITSAGEYSTLHQFDGDFGADGFDPVALTEGSDGNLYGTTAGGGVNSTFISLSGETGAGTAFQITKDGVFTSLYSFTGGADGSDPNGPLLEVSPGIFYSTRGGSYPYSQASTDDGAIYQLALVRHPSFFAGQAPLADGVYYLAFANDSFFG